MISLGFSSLFTVNNFAKAEDLQPLLEMIPQVTSPDEFEGCRREDKGPSREAGAHLIRRMTEFAAAAEQTYQLNLSTLDKASKLISHPQKARYLSLYEIANILLPKTLKSSRTGFPGHALYAVHTALYRNELVFRPVSPSPGSHRRDHMFEVFPSNDIHVLDRVATLVREYTTVMGQNVRAFSPKELEGSAMGNFIIKAREQVLESRAKRAWTPSGTLGPSSKPAGEVKEVEWSPSSRHFIRYLEWWASYDLFEESSRFHAYGSLILRALNLYPDAVLDQSTAWTFLQEIGEIQPWEIPSRYKVRFPNVKIESGGGLIREQPKDLKDSKRPDIAAGSRKEWTNAKVFCIDAPSTIVIDDGVSLERTEKPDEFWIHVHAADPASGIKPNSQLCEFMELIPENIYLPGHFQAMLPSDLGAEDSNDFKSDGLIARYSLAAGRPSLTFSAKVNESGDLLDYKVEPGTLQKVMYLDPDDVAKFCDEPPAPCVSEQSLVVGTLPEKADHTPNRPMITAQELDESGQDDLRVLYRLAEAIKQKRLDKGAWPYFFPRPSVTVAFPETTADSNESATAKTTQADPYIKIGYENSNGCSVVSNSMVLAGEIAARWCSDRGIPLPYRKDLYSSNEAYEYATKEIYPLIRQGIEPNTSQRQELARITGGIDLATTPGPYFLLGLDMYAKATSPLRRFSDLIVHWQIHAALATERSLGRPINASTDDLNEILPFTPKTLPKTLALLHMREKMARTVAHGSKEWILLALIRAWRFEKTVPPSMRFTVQSRWRQGLMGRLDLFNLDAIMDIDGLDEQVLLKDVTVGDQFDVEFQSINVHSRQILVKVLKYLGGGNSP